MKKNKVFSIPSGRNLVKVNLLTFIVLLLTTWILNYAAQTHAGGLFGKVFGGAAFALMNPLTLFFVKISSLLFICSLVMLIPASLRKVGLMVTLLSQIILLSYLLFIIIGSASYWIFGVTPFGL